MHLDQLERELSAWIKRPPYTVSCEDNFQYGIHFCRILIDLTPDIIPMLIGDFISNLRAALDHTAWQVAHLNPKKIFSAKERKRIQFPIYSGDAAQFADLCSLFPSTIANIFDELQANRGGNAYRDGPLWQLNKLWNMDKHRGIPLSYNYVVLDFPMFPGWRKCAFVGSLDHGLEVRLPLDVACAWNSTVYLKPKVAVDVLVGEESRTFNLPRRRLREIHNFVARDVVPRFLGFFP